MRPGFGYLLAPIIAFLAAQSIKYLLNSSRTRSWRDLLGSGHMPSSHAAVVTSLATVIVCHEGVSTLFALAATLAMVTIYDALVARRSIGEQGTALRKLLEKSPYARDPLPRVALGHTPLEVVAGIALGIVVGVAVAFFIT